MGSIRTLCRIRWRGVDRSVSKASGRIDPTTVDGGHACHVPPIHTHLLTYLHPLHPSTTTTTTTGLSSSAWASRSTWASPVRAGSGRGGFPCQNAPVFAQEGFLYFFRPPNLPTIKQTPTAPSPRTIRTSSRRSRTGTATATTKLFAILLTPRPSQPT